MIAGTVFEIAFTSSPFASVPVWVDCSRYLLEIAGTSGRHQDRDVFEPASYAIPLDNAGGEFHPLNTASPFWPNVQPMRLCRFRATSPTVGAVHTLFIEDWAPAAHYPEGGVVTVNAVDATAWLAEVDMPVDAYTGDVLVDNPDVWYRLDEDAGQVIAIDSSGDGNDGTYRNTSLVPGLAPALSATTARRFVTGSSDGVAANSYQITGTVQTLELWATLPPAYTAAGAIVPLMAIGQYGGRSTYNLVVDTDGTTNRLVLHVDEDIIGSLHGFAVADVAAFMGSTVHLVVVRNGAAVTMYANGVALAVTVTAAANMASAAAFRNALPANGLPTFTVGAYTLPPFNTTTVAAGGWSIAHAIVYPTALSPARVLSHYLAGLNAWSGDDTGTRVGRVLTFFGWPAGARVIDVGATLLGPATWDIKTKALDYLRLVELDRKSVV